MTYLLFLTAETPCNEVEIKLDGFNTELTIPFVTNEWPGPDPFFAMRWDVLADFNEDDSFKIAQLHILSIPAKR